MRLEAERGYKKLWNDRGDLSTRGPDNVSNTLSADAFMKCKKIGGNDVCLGADICKQGYKGPLCD